MAPLVVFRADGGPSIGGGHVMRCLALASAFAAGRYRVAFASTAETFKSIAPLANSNFEKLHVTGTPEEEARHIADKWASESPLLIVDHYGRDASFERSCRSFAKRIVVIDDLADRSHDADVLFDSGADSATRYKNLIPAACRVFTGPSYAIVHPDFLLARKAALPRRDGRSVTRILVTFGQIDAGNATALALDAIEACDFGGAVDVVLGQSAPHLAAIRRRAKHKINLHVNASNMPALIATSDLSIGAGGVTAFERCCLGLPSIAVEIACNQHGLIALLAANGSAVAAGAQDALTKEQLAAELSELLKDNKRRKAMSDAAAALVDGRGVDRMMAAIASDAVTNGLVTARLAEAVDEAWLLALQQKPETRRYANDPTIPAAEEHRIWFAETLSNPDRLLLILEAAGKRAGMLRLDRSPEADLVSIAIDPEFYRKGIAQAGLNIAGTLSPGKILNAQVHAENAASKALFSKAGYRHIDGINYKRQPV